MLNMDFSHRARVDTAGADWQASPKAGVWRKPLAREEAERGHATSIVRYDPGASFHAHDHPAGEEILVLEGTFSDETGDYGAGTYFRNPQGFRHAPFSREGCVILVKLHQFQETDDTHVTIDTHGAGFPVRQGALQILPLHEHGDERVALVRWPAGETVPEHVHEGGEEVYVISGAYRDEHGDYGAGTWVRQPHGSRHSPVALEDTLLWVKVGHLPKS